MIEQRSDGRVGLRRQIKVLVRKGVGSNPTLVITFFSQSLTTEITQYDSLSLFFIFFERSSCTRSSRTRASTHEHRRDAHDAHRTRSHRAAHQLSAPPARRRNRRRRAHLAPKPPARTTMLSRHRIQLTQAPAS